MKTGEIIEKDGKTWLYLHGVYSSFEPDKEKRQELWELGLKENISNLYNIVNLMNKELGYPY